jgi:hypothetical protein
MPPCSCGHRSSCSNSWQAVSLGTKHHRLPRGLLLCGAPAITLCCCGVLSGLCFPKHLELMMPCCCAVLAFPSRTTLTFLQAHVGGLGAAAGRQQQQRGGGPSRDAGAAGTCHGCLARGRADCLPVRAPGPMGHQQQRCMVQESGAAVTKPRHEPGAGATGGLGRGRRQRHDARVVALQARR